MNLAVDVIFILDLIKSFFAILNYYRHLGIADGTPMS